MTLRTESTFFYFLTTDREKSSEWRVEPDQFNCLLPPLFILYLHAALRHCAKEMHVVKTHQGHLPGRPRPDTEHPQPNNSHQKSPMYFSISCPTPSLHFSNAICISFFSMLFFFFCPHQRTIFPVVGALFSLPVRVQQVLDDRKASSVKASCSNNKNTFVNPPDLYVIIPYQL